MAIKDFLTYLRNSDYSGDLYDDDHHKILYSTDASEYKMTPFLVCIPRTDKDVEIIIKFASQLAIPIVPRAGGTSLAGQAVGHGIVIDCSKYMTSILDFDIKESTILVEPGLVRDELNRKVAAHGLFFSPITSTSNRATIGGMVANNSSGTTSIKYGVTRDKVIGLEMLLSNGDKVWLDKNNKHTHPILDQATSYLQCLINSGELKKLVDDEFPDASIHRRNTGYALDEVLKTYELNGTIDINKVICGSEGTLGFITKVKLQLDPLPPEYNMIVAIHFDSIYQAMLATQDVMKHDVYMCELMDDKILNCTKANKEYEDYRWFVEGDPKAVLLVELRSATYASTFELCQGLIEYLKEQKLGYKYPIIDKTDTQKVWKLRSGGLGLLANLSKDKRAVACIEDTAVSLEVLPEYILEFQQLMQGYGQDCVYYAHAGAGEIHLRPVLNLKSSEDAQLFYDITRDVAKLVKKYKGSFSGEHGDGRVRAPFLDIVYSKNTVSHFEKIKEIFDPKAILNPHKIVDPLPMNADFRFEVDKKLSKVKTFLDFSETGGILGMAEKCNGSGDCRKSQFAGGTMCPSYHATLDEKATTRGRANVLREVLVNGISPYKHDMVEDALELCLSCKGCTTECPSNVNMTKLKAEWTYQTNKRKGFSFRDKLVSRNYKLLSVFKSFPSLYNNLINSKSLGSIAKKILGVHNSRSIPKLSKVAVSTWYKKYYKKIKPPSPIKSIILFVDEFTELQDAHIGIACIELLTKLNYDVIIYNKYESGRAALSKGDLEYARKVAELNIDELNHSQNEIIGLEPSAILSFRDEYPYLVSDKYKEPSNRLSKQTYLIEEWISKEVDEGNIRSSQFHQRASHIVLHGHCHQKALSNINYTLKMLSLPERYTVENLDTGCCGMAGSFGYEKYEISKQIAGLTLLPFLSSKTYDLIAANGTSCRHQIRDLATKQSFHPVEILNQACKS